MKWKSQDETNFAKERKQGSIGLVFCLIKLVFEGGLTLVLDLPCIHIDWCCSYNSLNQAKDLAKNLKECLFLWNNTQTLMHVRCNI